MSVERIVDPARRQRADQSPQGGEDRGELDRFTLARAQRGDESARRAVVVHYQRPVFGLLSRMLWRQGDPAAVEDLAQETFLRVFRSLEGFDPAGRARLSTWILTIASRLAIDTLRRRNRNAQPLPDLVATGPSPDADLDRRQTALAIEHALDDLSPPYRAAFILRELHGLAYADIAQALEIDVGTVRSRLNRARTALRDNLARTREEMNDAG